MKVPHWAWYAGGGAAIVAAYLWYERSKSSSAESEAPNPLEYGEGALSGGGGGGSQEAAEGAVANESKRIEAEAKAAQERGALEVKTAEIEAGVQEAQIKNEGEHLGLGDTLTALGQLKEAAAAFFPPAAASPASSSTAASTSSASNKYGIQPGALKGANGHEYPNTLHNRTHPHEMRTMAQEEGRPGANQAAAAINKAAKRNPNHTSGGSKGGNSKTRNKPAAATQRAGNTRTQQRRAATHAAAPTAHKRATARARKHKR